MNTLRRRDTRLSHAWADRPPGPAGGWMVGNLQAYETDRLGFLIRLRDEYGRIASFDAQTTVVNDHVLADRVLRDPLRSFEISQNFLGQQLSSSEIEDVLEIRPLLNPGLRESAVASMQRTTRALTMARFAALSSKQPIDPAGPAERVISELVVRHYFGDDGPRLIPAVAALLDALEVVIGNVFALPASWRSPSQRRIERRYLELHREVSALLELRRDVQGTDMASLILGLSEGRHSVSRLGDLLIGSLLAAQRVPAAAAGWILMLVADNPSIQQRLRLEAETFDLDQIHETAFPASRYSLALATVLEALRLYPPTWLLARQATREVELDGYTFSAGHTFLVSPYVLHRDSSAFDNAATFDPDRWLAGGPPTNVYLPFGRGRHRCPGADLATNYLVAFLLTVLHRYGLERIGEVHADPRITLRAAGLRLSLTRRANARSDGLGAGALWAQREECLRGRALSASRIGEPLPHRLT